MGERLVLLEIFVGTNGSGKSHQIRQRVQGLKRSRTLVIPANRDDNMWHGLPELKPVRDFRIDPQDWKKQRRQHIWRIPHLRDFTGTRVLHIDEPEQMHAVMDLQTGFRDGALVVDDMKNKISTKGNFPQFVKQYFGSRRMLMIDTFLANWTWNDVNLELYGWNPRLIVFQTTVPPSESALRKMARRDDLMAVVNFVNAQNRKLEPGKQWYFLPFGTPPDDEILAKIKGRGQGAQPAPAPQAPEAAPPPAVEEKA